MTIQHPSITVVDRERHGEDLFRITFRSGEMASTLQPGNFVHIKVSTETDPLFRRAMSVYSCESADFSIFFRAIGRGTRLLSRLQKGDQVDMLGPLGNAFDLPGDDEIAILVAGGTGVPPLHFLASRLLESDPGFGNRMVFLCGISSADDLPLAEAVQRLGISCSLSSDDGCVGRHGLVTELLEVQLGKISTRRARVYSCGPDPMLRAVSRLCADSGVRCQVSLEGNMPCGLGTCLGCVVRSAADRNEFRRICLEGPVFNSNEVEI
jgi:dihydroorotate dehydrogenase electron transfer subunit